MVKALYITVALMLSLTTGIYLMKHFRTLDRGEIQVEPLHREALPSESKNPLMEASRSEFDRWLPPYCGPDLYLSKGAKAHSIDVCVEGTIQRVKTATGIQLSRADVLNPTVRDRWKSTMGVTH